jgi:hypothetical protein
MNNEIITLGNILKLKPDMPQCLLEVDLEPMNAAFQAINDTFTVSKEDFLKVAASNYGAIHFIGKAYLAAENDKKAYLAGDAFYFFNELQDK